MSSKSIITLLFRVMQMALDTLLIVADAVALLIPWTVLGESSTAPVA